MAATGFTPISLYYTTTAAATPSAGNLVAGELALNTLDEKLYFKNSAGTVKLLANGALNNYTTTGTGTVLALAATPTITNPTITAYLETAPAIANSSTAVTLALASGTVLSYTLTGNCTFTMPATTNGTSFIVRLIQDATGGRTATFTGVKWPGGTVPTITTTASTGVDIISFVCIASIWYGNAAQAFA
jgi:hypothetical protein